MKALQMRMHSVTVYSLLQVFNPWVALGGMVEESRRKRMDFLFVGALQSVVDC
jgi:hypothetical protein